MIHLYAEHLLNIRTLSIQASLSTISNEETRATLSADGSTLTLHHEGEKASIELHVAIPGDRSDATLTIPAAPTKDLTFRLQVEEKTNSDNILGHGYPDDRLFDPWTAASLTLGTEVSCSKCSAILLPRDRIHTWKDLPSEGWAEMMDFWHCHKPYAPHGHGQDRNVGQHKAYSAAGKLAIEAGVGLVGAMEFVFAREDTQNVTYNVYTPPETTSTCQVSCAQCHSPLGTSDATDINSSDRIRKSRLAVTAHFSSESAKSHSYEKWFTSYLLRSLESQGVRKFIVQYQGDQAAALKFWVFTPTLTVSSSAARTSKPLQVAKVMWQDCELPSVASEELNAQRLSEGDIEIPDFEYRELVDLLKSGSQLLPETARVFQQWRVSLLRRFDNADIDG